VHRQEPFCSTSGHGTRTWSLSDLEPCVGLSCADEQITYDSLGKKHTSAAGLHENSAGAPNSTESTDKNEKLAGSAPNTLLSIHRAAKTHAAPDGTIVLLLVTKGYADMLTNFLCAAHAAGVHNFLILTQDEEIRTLAKTFDMGVYSPALGAHTSHELSDADFGTVSYQKLVFGRTELAMELLLLGYRPVIADVDTVWLSNPLLHLPWTAKPDNTDDTEPQAVEYDVAITDDSGEVCGCFIALRNTDRAVRFWRQVHLAHRKLIVDALQTGNFLAFDESEQKIVTQLLYKGGYSGALSVLQLPSELFPSGYAYFTLQSQRVQPTPPVVVHNNYIVGQALKRARFQRYGLWNTLQRQEGSGSMVCVADETMDTWRRVFSEVYRNTTVPSLNLYLPVHDSVVTEADTVMVHVAAEGPLRIVVNGARADYRFPSANVHVDQNPPSHMEASPAVFAVLNISASVNHSVLAFTVVTRREDVTISADVGFHRSLFAIGRAGKHARRASRTVQCNSDATADLAVREAGSTAETAETAEPQVDPPYRTPPEYPSTLHFGSSALPTMAYSIRVLTYNRPDSLQRLLTSLNAANYRGRQDIPLHIIEDGARTPQVPRGSHPDRLLNRTDPQP
jgi:hypothetical protein